MFLIIEKDYTVSKSDKLTGHLRMRARQGQISLIDCKNMRGMNRATYPYSEHGDWSDVAEYVRDDFVFNHTQNIPDPVALKIKLFEDLSIAINRRLFGNQNEVANIVGTTQPRISAIANNNYDDFSLETIMKYHRLLFTA